LFDHTDAFCCPCHLDIDYVSVNINNSNRGKPSAPEGVNMSERQVADIPAG
jgi:hypothetical protein